MGCIIWDVGLTSNIRHWQTAKVVLISFSRYVNVGVVRPYILYAKSGLHLKLSHLY